jgi:hypothetical protein
MVASDASGHNFFRRLICPRTTVARTCFYPITGAATSSPPCSTSSPWRGSPVSTHGRGPPEALPRTSARKAIKAKRRRSHHIAVIGLRARIRHRIVADNTRRHLSLTLQAPDGGFGTHTCSAPGTFCCPRCLPDRAAAAISPAPDRPPSSKTATTQMALRDSPLRCGGVAGKDRVRGARRTLLRAWSQAYRSRPEERDQTQ